MGQPRNIRIHPKFRTARCQCLHEYPKAQPSRWSLTVHTWSPLFFNMPSSLTCPFVSTLLCYHRIFSNHLTCNVARKTRKSTVSRHRNLRH